MSFTEEGPQAPLYTSKLFTKSSQDQMNDLLAILIRYQYSLSNENSICKSCLHKQLSS